MIGVLHGDGLAPVALWSVSPDGRPGSVGELSRRRSASTTSRAAARSARPTASDGRIPRHAQVLARRPDDAGRAHEPAPSGPVVDLIDPRTRQAAAAHRARPVPIRRSRSVAFLPDGRDLLIVADPQRAHRRSRVGAAPVRRRRPAPPRAARWACRQAQYVLTTTPDRRHLFVTSAADGTNGDRSTPSGCAACAAGRVGDAAGSVSPDGRLFALGSPRGEVRAARPSLRTGPALHRRASRGRLAARVHARSADARRLPTIDGQLLVWDVARGATPRAVAPGTPPAVWGIAVSADGRTLYSAARRHARLAWDLAGDRRLDRSLRRRPAVRHPATRSPRGLAVSPDGAPPRRHADGTAPSICSTRDAAPAPQRACAGRLRRGGRLQPRRAAARIAGRGRAA